MDFFCSCSSSCIENRVSAIANADIKALEVINLEETEPASHHLFLATVVVWLENHSCSTDLTEHAGGIGIWVNYRIIISARFQHHYNGRTMSNPAIIDNELQGIMCTTHLRSQQFRDKIFPSVVCILRIELCRILGLLISSSNIHDM